MIVRPLSMLGVSDRDLAAAVQFQMEGLHPYAEDDVVSSWARLPAKLHRAGRHRAARGHRSLCAIYCGEAGIKIGAFTCSAAAIYSALRLFRRTPSAEFLAFVEIDGQSGILRGKSRPSGLFGELSGFRAARRRTRMLRAAHRPGHRASLARSASFGRACVALRRCARFGVPAPGASVESFASRAAPDRPAPVVDSARRAGR